MSKVLIGAIFLVPVFLLFIQLDTSAGLASVITGLSNNEQACINAINKRDGTQLANGDYIITHERINGDRIKDIIVKNNTDNYCGSVGCVYEICLQTQDRVELIPFSFAGDTLTVKNSLSENMHDLQLEGKSTVNLTWDHSRYITSR